jgi:hypothetical protein
MSMKDESCAPENETGGAVESSAPENEIAGMAESCAPENETIDAVIIETDVTPDNCPSQEDIAALAYSYWEARGFQGGSPEEDWLRAEQELLSGRPSRRIEV